MTNPMPGMVEVPFGGALKDDLGAPATEGIASLWWLGQAGFALRAGRTRMLLDPYLSDSLAAKYAGKPDPHGRMMPSPLKPEEARGVRWVLCSHGHSDHMDPGTLPAVAADNPECRFVVPRAERETALGRGVPRDRLVAVNAGDALDLGDGARIEAIPAAHEELETDAAGAFRHLGFIVRVARLTLYHSGDCIPYDGLKERLAGAGVNVALLPVNGRDAERTRRGIIGNFTFAEAANVCREASIPILMAHHFEMFEFNTVPRGELERQAAAAGSNPRVVLPRIGVRYELGWAAPCPRGPRGTPAQPSDGPDDCP
jgi:L-ascorbate metabolism protein UlaG (beta-lactamase superfamily)